MQTDEADRKAEGPTSVSRGVVVAAAMALTIAGGVGLVLVFPQPQPGGPVELARPAPVGDRPGLRAWPLPAPLRQQPAAMQPEPTDARAPVAQAHRAAAPQMRTRRLEMAQTARPHPMKPAQVIRTTATRRAAACHAPQTSADRLVCAYPALAAQDRELLAAYDRALAAGADKLALDRAQARWRGRRDQATSEGQLKALYARRIAELDKTARVKTPGGGLSI